MRLGEPALARRYTRELATLRPADVRVKMALFDLAIQTADHAEAQELIAGIRAIEGEQGAHWRLLQAAYVLDQARRDATKDLKMPREIAAQLTAERPDWWGASVLRGEIAELEGHVDDAIRNYTQAIELGNSQPTLTRRLVGLLTQRNDFGEIDRVINILSNRGTAVGDLTLEAALEAIRRKISTGASPWLARSFPTARHFSPITCSWHSSMGRPAGATRPVRSWVKPSRSAQACR